MRPGIGMIMLGVRGRAASGDRVPRGWARFPPDGVSPEVASFTLNGNRLGLCGHQWEVAHNPLFWVGRSMKTPRPRGH